MSDPAASPSGPARRWFEKPALSTLDRMPLLAEVMADVARAWTAIFGELSAAAGECNFTGLERGRVATAGLRRPAALLATLQAADWRATLGLQLDRAFLGMVVNAVFGGDGDGDGGASADGAPITAIEKRIADTMARQVAEALTTGFRPVLPTAFAFAEVQAKPEWSVLGKPAAELVIATFDLSVLGRKAGVDLLIPKTALDPLADHFAARSGGADPAPDAGWSRTFEAEVGRTQVDLSACIDLQPLTLGAIARFRPGDTIALPAAAGSNVQLRCRNGDLFRCELGQSAGFYTVRIEGEAGHKAAIVRQLEPIQARTAEQR